MRMCMCIIQWANSLRVVTEFHDQGLCEKALTAGGSWTQMFEVMRPGYPPFSQREIIIPLDLLDRCSTIYFHHNDNRDTRV